MANLASTYWNQGRWEAAEELQTDAMEARKKKLGADYPDTLTSMHNLAFAWKEQGRDEEAIRLMHECVLSLTRVLGQASDHMDICVDGAFISLKISAKPLYRSPQAEMGKNVES